VNKMSDGSQTGLAFRKENVAGTLDPGQFTAINFVDESLEDAIVKKESKTVRKDRQSSSFPKVDRKTGGDISTEFQFGNIDFLFASMLWVEAPVTPGTFANTTNFVTETVPGNGGNIVFNALDTVNIVPGNFFYLAGNANAANLGLHYAKAVNGKTVTVAKALVTENNKTVTVKGDNYRNGSFKTSWSIQKALYDASQFFLQLGSVVSSFELSAEASEILKMKLEFAGLSEQDTVTEYSSPAPTAVVTNNPFTAGESVANIMIDGKSLASCLVKSISFTYDNQVDGKKAVGTFGNCSVKAKTIKVKGKYSFYFQDATEYHKYKNGTAFSISIPIIDALGIYVFHLDGCEYDKASVNITGKEDDVMMDGNFMAKLGPNGFTCQITRIVF